MGKKSDLSAFDRGLVVGARRAGLSVSETAELLLFSRTTVSRVYTEWREKEKTSSERHFCGRKRLVNERGQRRLDRLVQSDRAATVAEITMRYNSGVQKGISESTARRTLKWMGYSKKVAAKKKSALGRQVEEIQASMDASSAQLDIIGSTVIKTEDIGEDIG